jgi:hypothetical protein
MTDAPTVPGSTLPASRPWLHALAVYAVLVLEAWIAEAVISAAPLLDLPWSGFFVMGQAALMAGTLGLLGWAFTRTGFTWIWAGAIGLVFGLLGPNLLVIGGAFGPWLQGLAPALATLILYRGRPRVTGIVTLSILIAVFVTLLVLILIALANWHFVF